MASFEIPTPEQMAAWPKEVREAAAATLLGTLQLEDRVSFSLFEQRARWPMPTIDVVALIPDEDTGGFKVPLAKRPPGDKWWPGQHHVNGSALLGIDFKAEHGEQDFQSIAARIGRVELRGALVVVDGPYEMYSRLRQGLRGPETTTFLVAGAEQQDELPEGTKLFPAREVVENPPEGGFIIGHDVTILRAVKLYEAHLSGERLLLPAFGPPLPSGE
jgi:hypothetical protein